MKREISERILCAAVWYKEIVVKKDNPINCLTGLVFSGHRHGQCNTKCSITGLSCESGVNEQGFLTSKNRFVSREEALQIALSQNQVDISFVGSKLYSEDLY